jgi:hypothetical protein
MSISKKKVETNTNFRLEIKESEILGCLIRINLWDHYKFEWVKLCKNLKFLMKLVGWIWTFKVRKMKWLGFPPKCPVWLPFIFLHAPTKNPNTFTITYPMYSFTKQMVPHVPNHRNPYISSMMSQMFIVPLLIPYSWQELYSSNKVHSYGICM